MKKQFFGAAALAALALQPAFSADWDPMLEAQLVKQSDWIVIGKVAIEGEGEEAKWAIEVERVIHGNPEKTIPIHPPALFLFAPLPKHGDRHLFCVGAHESGNSLYHPDCLRAVEDEADLLRAIEIYKNPAEFLEKAGDQNVVHVIGELFAAGRQGEVTGLTREDAVEYLRTSLIPDDIVLRRQVFDTLALIEDWSLVPKACELLQDLDGTLDAGHGVRAAIRYLEKSAKPEAIACLEQLLMETAPIYPEKHWLSDPAAEALGNLAAPSSRAIIEEAARLGVSRATTAMIYLGNEATFEMLMTSYLAEEEPGGQANTLDWLVRRSNREHEAWMTPQVSNTAILKELRPKWEAWWTANRDGFKLVKTGEQVVEEALARRRAEAKALENQN